MNDMKNIKVHPNYKNADEYLSACGLDDGNHVFYNAKRNIATLIEEYHKIKSQEIKDRIEIIDFLLNVGTQGNHFCVCASVLTNSKSGDIVRITSNCLCDCKEKGDSEICEKCNLPIRHEQ